MTRTPSPQQQAVIDFVRDDRRSAQLERQRVWYKNNKGTHNMTSRQNHMKTRMDAIQALGGLCECCGEHTYEFLVIDHRQGGGTKERKVRKESPSAFYRRLREEGYPREKYRILCHNCNFSLGLHGYCPHEHDKVAP